LTAWSNSQPRQQSSPRSLFVRIGENFGRPAVSRISTGRENADLIPTGSIPGMLLTTSSASCFDAEFTTAAGQRYGRAPDSVRDVVEGAEEEDGPEGLVDGALHSTFTLYRASDSAARLADRLRRNLLLRRAT
jgi:hypothetical protein